MNMKQRMPKRMPTNHCPPLISLLVSRLYICGMFFEFWLVTATRYQLICMYVLLSCIKSNRGKATVLIP